MLSSCLGSRNCSPQVLDCCWQHCRAAAHLCPWRHFPKGGRIFPQIFNCGRMWRHDRRDNPCVKVILCVPCSVWCLCPGPADSQAGGSKCLVQAGRAGAACPAETLQAEGDLHVWVCLAEFLTGLCASSLLPQDGDFLFSPENQAQDSVQTCQEGKLEWGEAAGVQQDSQPFRGDVSG